MCLILHCIKVLVLVCFSYPDTVLDNLAELRQQYSNIHLPYICCTLLLLSSTWCYYC